VAKLKHEAVMQLWPDFSISSYDEAKEDEDKWTQFSSDIVGTEIVCKTYVWRAAEGDGYSITLFPAKL
jgi:hypothetical protein